MLGVRINISLNYQSFQAVGGGESGLGLANRSEKELVAKYRMETFHWGRKSC